MIGAASKAPESKHQKASGFHQTVAVMRAVLNAPSGEGVGKPPKKLQAGPARVGYPPPPFLTIGPLENILINWRSIGGRGSWDRRKAAGWLPASGWAGPPLPWEWGALCLYKALAISYTLTPSHLPLTDH